MSLPNTSRSHDRADAWSHHIRIKLNGNTQKRDLFNTIVGHLDLDWPWAPIEVLQSYDNNTRAAAALTQALQQDVCPKCKGVVWKQPTLTSEDLVALVAQINDFKGLPGSLYLKIKRNTDERECEAPVGVDGVLGAWGLGL